MKKFFLWGAALFLLITFACTTITRVTIHNFPEAICVLYPSEGNSVRGVIHFYQQEKSVQVQGEITGLTPGKHGFHIHEKGDCSASDATSAGGHFNPFDLPHAGRQAEKRHVGDLGNIEADSNGRAVIDIQDNHLILGGGYSIVGLSVIVHASEDDLATQPTGDAGGRVACGVIGGIQ